ncbi:CDP-alcohol phosphatidyltransferase [Colletotrichum higginsianum IMI 349063]|uniref:CDP-alcohol phosphatidyltransferase n=2 Tax=Colletotrichum higginsianum TaxID=80884 RepID=A0A1B7YPC8_COLHI|nr:CDP-alcohol phosphatidyltransferase [Colletotrichum higginsianum IMI 349063]OBR13890.1 CDP-alcohol phosphatidyltransferase [Colletotrichum higginsianum IMI 349063]TID02688.1 putative cardiolipin synthase (CMP-forming) [Colletotrichum higginsianum]GJC95452.1 CDP-alcohol phosphatidyltransferase [Colletotrichum higginsianum]
MLLLRFGGRRTLVQCSRLPGSSIGNNRLLHTFPLSSTYRRPSLRRVAIPTTTSNIANGLLRPCPGHVALYASESDGKPPSTASKIAAKLPTLPKNIHEDIRTLPNLLTLSRLVAAPFVGYFILHDQHAWALGLFAYAGVTDLLDGWIARRWKQQTVVGTVIDPMADKMLMTILTVCLAAQGSLPVWLATIILGRDVGLAMSAIYYRWISLPPPKTFARYWDFSLPSAEVRPTTISKYNTFLQLVLIGMTTAAPVFSYDISTPLTIMQYIVATTTVWSGASYIYTKDAVKILTSPKTPPTKG